MERKSLEWGAVGQRKGKRKSNIHVFKALGGKKKMRRNQAEENLDEIKV